MAIHPTAIVDPAAELAEDVEIGPYSIIDGPVRIAAGTRLGPHVHLTGRVSIGRNCQIHTGAVIGDLPQDRSYRGGDTFVTLGDEVVIREYVTIHRGTQPGTGTTVADRALIMAHAHVGHNCHVGPDVMLVNGSLLGGHVTIGARAIVSGNAAVHQFARIGELAMIGGLAKITQDVPPFLMFDGHGLCVGLNLIGMKRAGIESADRAEIKIAYRRLYRVPGSLAAALLDLSTQLTTPTGLRFLEFMQTPSKRGIHGHSLAEAIAG